MTIFFKLFNEKNKMASLKLSTDKINSGEQSDNIFIKDTKSFSLVPGSPLSYWVSDRVTNSFKEFNSLQESGFLARVGLQTSDDFRFIRLWWETPENETNWVPHAKGGEYAEFYADVHLVVNWFDNGYEIKNFCDVKTGKVISYSRSEEHYYKPGITWTKSTTLDVSFRCMPSNSIFGVSGLGLIEIENNQEHLLALSSLANSNLFKYLISLSLGLAAEGRKHYEAGLVNKNPIPKLPSVESSTLSDLAYNYWRELYLIDVYNEISHAFIKPIVGRSTKIDTSKLSLKLLDIKTQIEEVVFNLYGVNKEDTPQSNFNIPTLNIDETEAKQSLLSWCMGVVFGRFDVKKWDFELEQLDRNSPFEPVPNISEGMLKHPSDALFNNNGIISNNLGRNERLHNLLSSVLDAVGHNLQEDLELLVEKSFFALHLSKYSKSRRQAPIYWQLATLSGKYSMWIYYHKLTNQTLLSCVNDFVVPQLDELNRELSKLRNDTAKSSAEEKRMDFIINNLEQLGSFYDELLRLSKFWQPNLNDGVQITAAPLWRLFQHKAWQKKLKQTWENLEDGDYDWAHLAFSTWPERVLKKCHADRSLAIAHDVENELWHEVEVIKARKKEPVWEWQPKPLSPAELYSYIKDKIATDDRLKLYLSNNANANGGT